MNAQRWLLAILSLAFAVRLPLLLTPGFDIVAYKIWARVIAPLLITAALDRRYRPLYAALALTFLINLALEDPPLHRFVAD